MSKGDTFENDNLKLWLNAVPIANIADNAASAPLTNLYLTLHIADPGDAGNQATSEIAYTGYARAVVSRTSVGWTVAGNVASLTSDVSFPTGTGGSGTATWFGVGTSSVVGAAGKLLWKGAISPSIVCGNGVTPILTTGTTITED